jgi:heptosyltransferase-2
MDNQAYQKVIIRMPNWLGDVVMATPFIEMVKKNFPKAKITVMCKHPYSQILLHDPHIDELFSFKRSKPFFLRRDDLESITEHLKIGQYDLGFLLTNSLSSAWWFFQGGVKRRVGFKNGLRNILLTDAVYKPKKSVEIHQVDEYLLLLDVLGVKKKSIEPKLYLSQEEKKEALALFRHLNIKEGQKVIGICPGAAYGSAKCWPKEYFIELLQKFDHQNEPVKFLFLGDRTQEVMIEEIVAKFPKIAINLAGKTTIRELMSVIGGLDLLLTNDSGPMHVAQALNTKLIALFGSTSPKRTGPYRSGKVLYNQVKCSPCYKRECPIDFPCMRNLTPQVVYQEIASIILNP